MWTIAKKDLRLLLRDARAIIILLALPIFFILVLGVSLGEGFGKKSGEGLRVSVLNLDRGLPRHFDSPSIAREVAAWTGSFPLQPLGGIPLALLAERDWYPNVSWSEILLRDLGETAKIKVELIPTRAEAEALVHRGKRAAVLVLNPQFSQRMERCSFRSANWGDALKRSRALPTAGDPVSLMLAAAYSEEQEILPLYLLDGLNPFYRDGIKLEVLDVDVIRDKKQQTAASIIDQVAQGSLLRIVMPWMIGRAFEKLSDPQFLALLGREEELPTPVKMFLTNPLVPTQQKRALSGGLQNALQNLFPSYNLTAKTWAALTKEAELEGARNPPKAYEEDGQGWLRRGSSRYQLLVPAYLVMFAFFLVLTVGWLFVAERRQGTMRRLMAAPLTQGDILIGKLIPCLLVSLFQGFVILIAGRIFFAMNLGPAPLWLIPVVVSTSLAAMGLAMLIAALARSETQVAIYGTLLVLVLAGLSGGLMGDRSMMPPAMEWISLVTPNAWALDAYRELLLTESGKSPNLVLVMQSCEVLVSFGCGFLLLSWWFLKLEG